MTKISAIIFAVLCALGAFHFTVKKTFTNPYPVVCDLVAEKIYLENETLKNWKRTCLQRAKLVNAYSKKSLVLKDINNVLAVLQLSHLEIYSPSRVTEIWQGKGTETGIDSEFVDGELVVFHVHAQSPADQSGVRRGDIIVSINSEQPNPWDAGREKGNYLFRRHNVEKEVFLTPSEVQRNDQVRLVKFNERQGQLIIPSFRSEFFTDPEKWAEMIKLKDLVVDLRGNSGGNFVGGLRILSSFFCDEVVVGQLIKPRIKEKNEVEMPDVLNDMDQLALLNSHSAVNLKTFPVPSCFKGRVSVLVDNKTSSVAEMVAQALKEYKGARLLGTPSRAELLVGVWYPVDELGQGTQISIPEAIYVSGKGHHIEGEGVALDRVLYYNLQEMQAGVDSWVKQALDQGLK